MATATKSIRNRSARRRNRQMITVVDHREVISREHQAWEQLKATGRTTVNSYGTAVQFKMDYDESGKHTNDRVYITPLAGGGYSLRVVNEDPADQPHMSTVLSLVCEAEEWGTTVDVLSGRKDSTRKGLSGERLKRANAAAAAN